MEAFDLVHVVCLSKYDFVVDFVCVFSKEACKNPSEVIKLQVRRNPIFHVCWSLETKLYSKYKIERLSTCKTRHK